jgi:hypothetical protein
LRDGGFVMLTEYFERAVLKLRGLGPQRHDTFSRCACFPRKMFLPRCVPMSAPRRHGSLHSPRRRAFALMLPLDPTVGINAGRKA